MPYTLSFNFNAGSGNVNPALCSAVLQPHGAVTTAALAASTTVVNTAQNFYFKHRANGLFSFVYDVMPDDFRGNVDFYYNSVIVASVNVNPQETEYADTKTSAVPSAVRTNLATELARIDATISSRNAVAPDNATISAISLKTANLPASPAAVGSAMTLATAEHTAIAADTQSGLTAQGYTTARAGYLDTLNGIVAEIWGAGTRTLSAFGFTVNTNVNATETAIADSVQNIRTIDVPALTTTINNKPVTPETDVTAALTAYNVAKKTDVQVTVPAPIVNTTTQTVDVSAIATTTQLIEEDVTAIRARLAEQVAEPTPVVVVTASSDPAKRVVFVEVTEWGTGSKSAVGVSVKARLSIPNKAVGQIGTKLVFDEGSITKTTDAERIARFELIPNDTIQPVGSVYVFEAYGKTVKAVAIPSGAGAFKVTL